MRAFKDAGHLLRLAALYLIGTLLFLGVRAFYVPKNFGLYGHYRANAITEIANRPPHYAGHQACETCHSDVFQKRASGKHAGVNCEACHGPLQKHVDDPSIDPGKPDVATLCIRCHAASAARPKWFPQVDAASHSAGVPCDTCHQPYNPAIGTGGTK